MPSNNGARGGSRGFSSAEKVVLYFKTMLAQLQTLFNCLLCDLHISFKYLTCACIYKANISSFLVGLLLSKHNCNAEIVIFGVISRYLLMHCSMTLPIGA